MSKERKSFVLHKDSLDILPDLTDEQAGKLFKAIHSYQVNEDLKLDQITKMVFLPFKNQFIRDNEKYAETCERRAIAGSKGGKQKVANANNSKQKVANLADSVSKNKSDSKSDSNNEVIKDIVTSVPKFNFKNEFLSLGVDKQILDDWLTVRKKKKASNTKTAFNAIIKEISNTGLMVGDAIEYAASKSWSGFKAQWYFNENPQTEIKQYSDVTAQNIKNLEDW